jgi:hypothetical protein
MNPTLVFALVIAVESLAVIVVIVGVCFLIWGDFSVESDTGVRGKAPTAPVKTTSKKTTIPGTPAAPSAPLKKTASSTAAAAPSSPKVVMTKTTPPS